MAKDSVNVRSTKSSAAKTSSSKSSSEWREPEADWIPIGRAVFRFGIAKSDSSPTAETPSNGIAFFSREAFEQSRKREGGSSPNIANYDPEPPSLVELTKLLQEKTHAREVEIGQEGGHFWFSFDLTRGGSSTMGGAPWAILAKPVTIDPRIEAEALFNKEGLVRISDEKAAEGARQFDAVRKATGLVWRQYMLPAFGRAVSVGGVALYARMQSPSAPLKRLPADIWPILDVLDWQYGIARDLEGAIYYSVHAVSTFPATSPKQRSTIADEKAATNALAQQLKLNPDMTRAEALLRCKSSNHRVSNRGVLNRIWPRARELAGLSAQAPPGRKEKSKR
jgi:hypothetical protein